MILTRRTVLCGLAVGSLSGCISDPGASCRGATVRVSMQPTASDDDSHIFESASLSAEAVGVLETAIEGEHVEHCVNINPGRNETGPSAGLAELIERLEAHAEVELEGRTEPLTTTVRFNGDTYLLELTIDPDDADSR